VFVIFISRGKAEDGISYHILTCHPNSSKLEEEPIRELRAKMRETTPQGAYKIQALDRAFAILDLLGESETPLGLAQVATSLQMHKSTAHRFLMVLEKHRMVERTAGGKFRLGLRLFDFGSRAIEKFDLRERAQPHLRRLVNETEETAHLCILEGAHVVYIDKIEPARAVRMITRIGASNPVHCTSVGKAMLAFLPEERLTEILSRLRFERFTNRTVTTVEALRAEIEKTRRRGYAVDDEEFEEGLRCIAVPILDAQRLPVAAVSVSGPSFRVTAQKLPSIANHLLQCVRSISVDMGFVPSGRGNRAVWPA
jgi:DNA-binding IclR family transcriptional regulator